jgi:hypothetical protein
MCGIGDFSFRQGVSLCRSYFVASRFSTSLAESAQWSSVTPQPDLARSTPCADCQAMYLSMSSGELFRTTLTAGSREK